MNWNTSHRLIKVIDYREIIERITPITPNDPFPLIKIQVRPITPKFRSITPKLRPITERITPKLHLMTHSPPPPATYLANQNKHQT